MVAPALRQKAKIFALMSIPFTLAKRAVTLPILRPPPSFSPSSAAMSSAAGVGSDLDSVFHHKKIVRSKVRKALKEMDIALLIPLLYIQLSIANSQIWDLENPSTIAATENFRSRRSGHFQPSLLHKKASYHRLLASLRRRTFGDSTGRPLPVTSRACSSTKGSLLGLALMRSKVGWHR